MRVRIPVLLILAVALPFSLNAQRGGGGKPGPSGTTLGTGTSPNMPNPDYNSRPFFISGKVVVDDGTQLTDPATIQSLCKGRTHTEGYTDSKGHFSFEINALKNKNNAAGNDQAMDSSEGGMARDPSQTGMGQGPFGADSLQAAWRDCELRADLPGFTSQVLELSGRLNDSGATDVGAIVLHRLVQVQGLTLSATSAAAPSKAKKEYDKGRELEQKQKWDAALESFQKAAEVYPGYAIAWLEMGRVQVKKNDPAGARESFHKALSADAKFVSPYQELAQLAVRDQQWQEVVDTTDEVLKLNPLNFPQDWLLNALGNYRLQHLDVAEKSARRGVEVDGQHQFPKLEYLLGMILAQKRDYAAALEHVRNYLRLAPHAADAEVAQKQAQELERLSANVTAVK